MKNIKYLLIIGVIISACDEIIQLDQGQLDNKVVIDALLTNDPAVQYIRLTRNVSFYQEGGVPAITNANVTITDDQGNVHNFIPYAGNNSDSAGYYLASVPFAGEIGHSYTLDVVVDGVNYSATDEMSRVLTIDSLSTRKDPDPSQQDKDKGKLYQALLYTKEPQDTQDYYYFEFLKNDTIQNEDQTDIFVADDAVLSGQVNGLEFPYNYTLEDSVTIRIYSLSRPVYVYFSQLVNVLGNDGGMFSPPPGNPQNNISNGALGIFQVSALAQASIVITE